MGNYKPDCINCPHSRKNGGKCDYSCHSRSCRCGSCGHGQEGQCEDPSHGYNCHCGYKAKPQGTWHGIAE